jgi:hypothetical protein
MDRVTPSVRRNRISVALTVSTAVLAGLLSMSLRAVPALSAADVRVDLSPEPAAATVGVAVTLTLRALDGAGAPVAGANARVYFVSGPDEPGGHGNSPDFRCTTGADGTCSISYAPADVGTDVVCAVVTGSPWQCDEPAGAPELDNNVDVVEVIISLDETAPPADPTPAPDPTVAPTAEPDPTAVPTAVPDPTVAPDPTSEPTAVPDPTAAPTAVPAPTAAPTQVPDPTAAPTAVPAPTAAPTQVPDPTAAPTASAAPLPTATAAPDPASEPTVAPTVAPTAGATNPPAPGATAAAEPVPSPDAVPSPLPTLPLTGAVEPGGTTSSGSPQGATGGSGPSHDGHAKGDDGGLLGSLLSGLAKRITETVRPEAVEAIARSFGFPLALALLVIIFLLVQDRLDDRDPKLRHAPRSAGETYIAFEEDA